MIGDEQDSIAWAAAQATRESDAEVDDSADERELRSKAEVDFYARVNHHKTEFWAKDLAREEYQREKGGTTGWEPINLAPFLLGDIEPPRPDMLQRSDGHFLLYRGALNTFFGRGGSGKTMLTLLGAKEELLAGGYVVFVDYEGSGEYTATRLRQLGVPIDIILERFIYIQGGVGEPPSALVEKKPLVIVDATNGAIVAHGLRVNDIEGFETVVASMMTPFTVAGGTGLLIDHITNNAENGGRPIGSVQKFNRIQGAAYKIEEGVRPSPGTPGWSSITLSKDNKAGVERLNEHGHAGYLIVEGTADRLSIEAYISTQPPLITAIAGEGGQTTDPRAMIISIIGADPGAYTSVNALAAKLHATDGSRSKRTWTRLVNDVKDEEGSPITMLEGHMWLSAMMNLGEDD